MELQTLISNIISELDSPTITRQRRRYLESYKEDLEKYYENHPNVTEAPNSFELFCDLNPFAPECIKYDV